MYKRLLPFTFFICLLYVSGYATSQSAEEILENIEISNDSINDEYKNPRESLYYDKDPIKSTPIDQESIRDYQKDKDFDYKEELPEDNWWTRFKQKVSDFFYRIFNWLFEGTQAEGAWLFIIEVLPYLLIAGFIALIIWIFLKIDSGKLLMEKIKAPETLLSDDEALIKRPDLQNLIDQALASNNYRLAIRFYYLLVLQQMSGKDLIDWQVQKTNHDYIYEIKDTLLRKQFMKVTDIYDYIWYGNFEVNETAFAKAQSSFKTLNTSL